MLKAKKITGLVSLVVLLVMFFILPTFVYVRAKGVAPINSTEYVYKFNEITQEGYPAIIDTIKREAGFEDSETTQLPDERLFIPNTKSWSFKLDDNYILIILFNSSTDLQTAVASFYSNGFTYVQQGTTQPVNLYWQGKPKMYSQDNVLAIYTGSSNEINNIIKSKIGKQVKINSQKFEVTK